MKEEDTKEDLISLISNDIKDFPEGIILPVDKPFRWTSADLVRKIKFAAKRHFDSKKLKVGHAGTLDPLATGILIVCVGAATKRAEELLASPKEYVANVSFGASTASYDLEKELVFDEATRGSFPITEENVRRVLPSFLGVQEQFPPLFSAKSIDGVRAYQKARTLTAQNREAELQDENFLRASTVEIYELELLSFEPEKDISSLIPQRELQNNDNKIHLAEVSGLSLPTATIRVVCSKGTYIRSLARDLGKALGMGAFLSSLHRTKNGGFTEQEALSLERVLEMFA